MPVKERIVHAWEVIKDFSQHSSWWTLDFFTFQLFNETVYESSLTTALFMLQNVILQLQSAPWLKVLHDKLS